jgi:poly(beta-D-mannuronate) lyase
MALATRRLILIGGGAWLGLAGLAGCQPPGAQHLRSPFAALKPVQAKRRVFACAAPTDPVVDLVMPSKYRQDDPQRETIDESGAADYELLSSPVYDFMNQMSEAGDTVAIDPQQRGTAAACIIDGLTRWARAGALLGESNATGDAVRKWELASVALVHLKLRDHAAPAPELLRPIESWLRRLAYRVRSDYGNHLARADRNNNHAYWAAWAVAAAGLALDDRKILEWGLARYRRALTQIGPDGALPLEMARGSRALQYHVFALAPLIMLAESGEANSLALYRERDGALLRLIDFVLDGLDDPAPFAARAGKPQILRSATNATNLAWLEFYHRRFSDSRAQSWLQRLRPMRNRRLGGDLTALLDTHSDS